MITISYDIYFQIAQYFQDHEYSDEEYDYETEVAIFNIMGANLVIDQDDIIYTISGFFTKWIGRDCNDIYSLDNIYLKTCNIDGDISNDFNIEKLENMIKNLWTKRNFKKHEELYKKYFQ